MSRRFALAPVRHSRPGAVPVLKRRSVERAVDREPQGSVLVGEGVTAAPTRPPFSNASSFVLDHVRSAQVRTRLVSPKEDLSQVLQVDVVEDRFDLCGCRAAIYGTVRGFHG